MARICNCGLPPQGPGPHPVHYLCGCTTPENCVQEARSGCPTLHKGQPGYEEAAAAFRAKNYGKQAIKEAKRQLRGTPGYVSPLRALWQAFVGAGMYSSDPAISHPAMLITGQRLLRENQQLADQRAYEQAELTARLTAVAMVDEIERRAAERQAAGR